MKSLRLISAAGIFYLAFAFTACNENPKDDDPTSTITPGRYSNSDTAANKNITTNDTLKTPGVEGGAINNNPDITK